MEPAELFEVGDAEERVADLDGVVEEREGPLPGHGGEPERELGHLGGDGVLVDAVEAVVDDLAAGEDDLLLGGRGGEVGEAVGERPFAGAVLDDGFDEAVGEVAAGGGEDRAGADGGVADAEVEDLGRGAQLPLLGVGLVLRAGLVDERLERVLDDLFGERLGGVLRAHVAAGRGLGDVLRAGQQHDRQAAQVGADESPERQDPRDGVVVVPAGDAQPGEVDALGLLVEQLGERGRRLVAAGPCRPASRTARRVRRRGGLRGR